jgi:hypothetical protein
MLSEAKPLVRMEYHRGFDPNLDLLCRLRIFENRALRRYLDPREMK